MAGQGKGGVSLNFDLRCCWSPKSDLLISLMR
jgi:hypothetical protein